MNDQIIYKINHLPNIGYLTCPTPKPLLKEMWDEINQIGSDFAVADRMNDKLAGNIQNEYALHKCRSNVGSFVSHMVDEYEKHFNYLKYIHVLNKNTPVTLNSLWVNFQKKYEFNPLHDHAGVFSFVFWMKIPFNKNEEAKIFADTKPSYIKQGCFEFAYQNVLGDIQVEKVDDSVEGNFCLFPAGLNHSVYPFYTSDEYRITVAGNLNFEC